MNGPHPTPPQPPPNRAPDQPAVAAPSDPLAELLPFRAPLDAAFSLSVVPSAAGVFLIETAGEPYIGKSAGLRRRLARVLGMASDPPPQAGAAGHERTPARRARLNLRDTARAIRYRPTGSLFETALWHYRLVRTVFPDRYRQLLRLRVPPLLKLNLDQEYPRCCVTRRIGRARGIWFGPFPNRTAADKFASGVLDLFLVRRCPEAIRPDPAHPGCIYGEMNMCLRPCQARCTDDEYRAEAGRLAEFFATSGTSLLKQLETARDQASEALDFEEAARVHKRAERVREALKGRSELATDLETLHGLVVQPSATPQCVELFPVWRGFLLPQVSLNLAVVEGRPVSLDARVRDALTGIKQRGGSPRLRGEHLSLLARWFYRGTRKGEFIAFDNCAKPPFRKIVNAINRVTRSPE